VVINADSLQVYAALPLLTAQPDAAMQAACPHRLYGYLPPTEALTAVSWAAAARQEIAAARADGLVPVLVGGSGLYLEALLEGLSAVPTVAPAFRQQAARELAEMGPAEFHRQLVTADPPAVRLHPSDTQRVLRAREVYLATGRSLSAWQAAGQDAGIECRRIAVLPERAALYTACNQRFLAMLDAGAIDDVQAFQQQAIASPVTRALGYAEITQYLAGEIDRLAMIGLAQAATRHYAKRQNTWFKNRFSQSDTYRLAALSTDVEIEKAAFGFTTF
jgi:tRNA dimethylallyltransferase